MTDTIALEPIDSLEVTVLVENTMDVLMPGRASVTRAPIQNETFERAPLLAEHGFAVLVTASKNGHRDTILYDAGLGQDTIIHNMDVLGIDAADIRAIVLSHGHTDHHGGLLRVLQRLGKRNIPLVLHPDVWRDRKGVFPGGGELHLPPPSRADLEREGARVLERRDPSLLLDNSLLVTGQVERTTDFEKGMATHMARSEGGEWEPDPWLWDDQALIANVKGQGLVVLSGCSHAGIINILRYARKLTGVDEVHAVAGGLHLSGAAYDPIIPSTVDALAAIAPAIIMPGHCTGWKAMHTIAQRMPDAYVNPCVGTRLVLGA